MKIFCCIGCGSKELTEKDGLFVCAFCQSKNLLQSDEVLKKTTTIGISSDIEILIQKCKSDPINSRRFANLILDIDPTNIEATKYLR